MNLVHKVSGEYRVRVLRAGLQIKDTGWMPNIVTNIGLDRMLSRAANPTSFCRVGTGSATPVATDTVLGAQIGSQGSAVYATGTEGAPNYGSLMTATYTFAIGAVVGNVTELGVGGTSAGADLFSRALVLDGGGAPTSISVTAADQLIVVYRLRYLPPITDNVAVVNLSGTNYTFTGRVSSVGTPVSASLLSGITSSLADLVSSTTISVRNTGGVLGAITATPTGGTAIPATISESLAAYTAGTFQRDFTITMLPANGNQAGGIVTMLMVGVLSQDYQYRFSPAIPKDNTRQLVLTFRTVVARV